MVGRGGLHHEGRGAAWGRNQRAGRHGETSSTHPTRFVLVLSPAGTVLVLESSPANVAGGLEYEHRFEYEYRRKRLSTSTSTIGTPARHAKQSEVSSTARPWAAAKERFRTCSAGHRRLEIEIEIEIGIDWFHAARKARPIDADFDFDFDPCAPCEEAASKEHEGELLRAPCSREASDLRLEEVGDRLRARLSGRAFRLASVE